MIPESLAQSGFTDVTDDTDDFPMTCGCSYDPPVRGCIAPLPLPLSLSFFYQSLYIIIGIIGIIGNGYTGQGFQHYR